MRRPTSIQDARFIASRRWDSASTGALRRIAGEDWTARRQAAWFIEDLQRLNDALAGTTLADLYWVWGGLLIGWARHRSVLEHDSADADFGILSEHRPCFDQAVSSLVAAGFRPLHRFVNNAGRVTEYSFLRRGAKFDFFICEHDAGELRYHSFSLATAGCPPTQAVAAVPDQPTSRFSLVGRTWQKHTDHDAELTCIYGDWRTPDPDWRYMDSRAIVQREPWLAGRAARWTGEGGDP